MFATDLQQHVSSTPKDLCFRCYEAMSRHAPPSAELWAVLRAEWASQSKEMAILRAQVSEADSAAAKGGASEALAAAARRAKKSFSPSPATGSS